MRSLRYWLAFLAAIALTAPSFGDSAVYNTSPPTPSPGSSVSLQADSSGNLKVSVAGGGGGSVAATTTVYPSSTPSLTPGTAGEPFYISTDGLLKMLGSSVYNTSPPSPSNGQSVPFQADSHGNLWVNLATLASGADTVNGTQATTPKVPIAATYAPTTYQSAVTGSQVVSANIKASAGELMSVWASNADASTRYLWITNAASGPANALASSDPSVKDIIPLFTNTSIDLSSAFFTAAGMYCSTGISFGFSTSATSYTAGTASEHILDANYF